MFKRIQNWLRRRQYQDGKILSRFIARDIRRDIQIVSAAKVEEGIIIGRVRTTNVLYVTHHLARKSEFGPPQELLISEMWRWTGQPSGGLPDGTSLVARPNVKPQDGET